MSSNRDVAASRLHAIVSLGRLRNRAYWSVPLDERRQIVHAQVACCRGHDVQSVGSKEC